MKIPIHTSIDETPSSLRDSSDSQSRLTRPDQSSNWCDSAAFTFVELLAVLTVVTLLGALLVPALANAKPNVHAMQCLENLRRLGVALSMYTGDDHDLFPPNMDDGNTIPGYNWCGGDVSGGNPTGSPGGAELYDSDILADPARCLVAPYLGGNTGVFKCPADPRFGQYTGSNPEKKGTLVPASRSISMNQAVGTMDPGFAAGGGHSGKPALKVFGPWLTGNHSESYSQYATFGKQTDFGFCRPASIFVLADEDPYSINDDSMAISAGQVQLIDCPASYHDNGCGLSFADGHSETHIWKTTVMKINFAQRIGAIGSPSHDDWLWLASHTTKNTLTGNVP